MERSDELNDQVEAYLSGTLTGSQKTDFETRLANDPELQAEVDRQRKLLLAFELLKYKREFAHQKAVPSLRETKVRKLEWMRYAAAASVALFLLAGLLYKTGIFTTKSRLAYDKYYEPETYARGGCPQDLPAFKLYAEGKYNDALQKVASLTGDSSACISYFKGLCYLAMDNSKLAIPFLSEASVSGRSEIHQKAQWYLSMAFLEADRSKEARKLLTEIATAPSHPYQRAAQEIIDDFFTE